MAWKEFRRTLSDRLKGRRRVFYNDAGKLRVIYELPPTSAPTRDSVLVFAMPKAGSVLLERCMMDLAAAVDLKYISISVHFFKLGLPVHVAPRSTSRVFASKGYCYGGFRGFPTTYRIPILRRAKKILLLRDPRDMLTSLYFSKRDSHKPIGNVLQSGVAGPRDASELAKSLDIDTYVEQLAPDYQQKLKAYRKLCSRYDVRVYQYETIIYDKLTWIRDICNYFNWDVPDERCREIAAQHDVVPSEETNKHIRQVHPGDHARKLKPETIRRLTEMFQEDMRFFGYSDETIRGAAEIKQESYMLANR